MIDQASCHLAHIPGPGGHGLPARSAVWICEHPYPTMRLQGPSAECGDCPVWREIQRARTRVRDRTRAEEVEQLEALLGKNVGA